jgi:hypothetical protein
MCTLEFENKILAMEWTYVQKKIWTFGSLSSSSTSTSEPISTKSKMTLWYFDINIMKGDLTSSTIMQKT